MIEPRGDNNSVLVINLKNIKKNYRIAKSLLKPATECAAVIKANAYGLGFAEVGKALNEEGCKHFFVANLSEGLELRKLLPNANIYVLLGLTAIETEVGYRHNLIFVLNDLKDLENYAFFAKQRGIKLPIILNIDTGMGRLGLTETDFKTFLKNFDNNLLEIKYVMSHLACGDEPQNELNKIQLERFTSYMRFLPGVKSTLANSSTIYLSQNYHFDLVRPGCMLYGINPTPYITKSPVETVVTIYGKVLQIRTLDHDQTISYGATYSAKKGDKIATIACGYADGYHRIMSNNTYCYFKGYKLPIVGIITMDMVMVDINTLPEAMLDEFNFVELLGDNVKVEILAANAKTIGYEILTSLGNRFNRIYIE